MSIEQRYTAFEKAKDYTKKYTLDANDEFVTKQSEDGMLAYVSAGQLATTGSNIFIGGQIIDGNITIVGDIFANTFNVTTTSIEHFTASTKFGLDDGDTHQFTGSVKITGSLDVIGGISGQINATNNILSSSTQITSLGFVSGSYETTGRNILSGSVSYNNLTDIPQNIASGSYETTGRSIFSSSLQLPSGLVSGSSQISSFGFVSGSYETTGRGILSGSISYTDLTNIPQGIASGSYETTGRSIVSSSAQITTLGFASGSYETTGRSIISSSAQIKNYGDFATTGSNNFVGALVVTGSLLVSGSGTLTSIGNIIATGSLLVSGSTTQIGNNTLIGNTVMSGSLEISGSQTRYGVTRNIGQWELTGSMSTSGSTRITGNTTIGGNLDLTGSIRVSGSFTGSLQVDGDINLASPHTFYRWGNKLFNYGSFYNTTSQSGSANTAYSVLLNTTDIADGFSIVSGSRITAANTGVYNLQFSSQLYANDDVKTQFSFWLAYTGSNVANTQSELTIPKEPNPGGSSILSLNLLTRITAGDYVELKYSKTTTLGSIQYIGEGTAPTRPAAPSTIVTLTQIA